MGALGEVGGLSLAIHDEALNPLLEIVRDDLRAVADGRAAAELIEGRKYASN